MIQTLQLTAEKECLALIADITYKNEASWFGEAERPLILPHLTAPSRRQEKTGGTLHLPVPPVYFCMNWRTRARSGQDFFPSGPAALPRGAF